MERMPPRPRLLARQAFSRAAGALLSEGNAVRLLRDARENYPAWLEAIAAAEHWIHFECYILRDDVVGRQFAEALSAKARAGVRVRLVYDWMGGLGSAGGGFWRGLRHQGVDVRCFNPPHFAEPFGWLLRDHRKCLEVDGRVAFVTGLCVAQSWAGDPAKGLEPWRDTGVELRGPAVRDVALAFADTWSAIGEALPAEELAPEGMPAAGDVDLRVMANTAGTGSIFRLDTLVTALARRTLWLTDAYYAGTGMYVESLRAAAQDGVDVRLLVPGRGSDLTLVQAISRAGYRTLLEGGVRVFEWNGPMIHAKTAVADGHWARVGSTNLNLASWIGNRELDVMVENPAFAAEMEAMYLEDLKNATEIVLDPRLKVRSVTPTPLRRMRGAGGSAGRAAAGALRLGNALGAAMTRRVLGRSGSRLTLQTGLVLLLLSPIGFLWPKAFAWPAAAIGLWLGLAWVTSGVRQLGEARRIRRSPDPASATETAATVPPAPAPAVEERAR